MKVLFDHQIFLSHPMGGIPRYIINLAKALKEENLCQVEISCVFNRNIYLHPIHTGISIMNFKSKWLNKLIHRGAVVKPLMKVNEYFTKRKLSQNHYDIIHVTYEDFDYVNENRRQAVVLTMHDLIPELFPEYFPDIEGRMKQRRSAMQNTDHIICISEVTKKDLMHFYGVPAEKISLVYHGQPDYLDEGKKIFETQPPPNMWGNYLLYIGDRDAVYKNFWPFLEHLQPSLQSEKDLQLLCVGIAFSEKEQEKIRNLQLIDKVKSWRASDNELYTIYKYARVLILPSLYEGFGFPLLEAMKAECPILSSNASCLPEIAGNSALYFDPATFTDFTSQLNSLLQGGPLLDTLKENQKERLQLFSWSNTAHQTYQAYQKASKKNRL